MRTQRWLVLLGVLFIFVGCPGDDDDDASGDDDSGDDDTGDDDTGDDDVTGDDDATGDDDDVTGDDDATGDDDDSSHQVQQSACAIFLPSHTAQAGTAVPVRVSMEPPCEGINWVLTPTYSVNGQTVTIDATWEYDVIDDDGACCGNVQDLDVTGLAVGTYTINAVCHSSYAEQCAEDSFPAQDFTGTATVEVTP